MEASMRFAATAVALAAVTFAATARAEEPHTPLVPAEPGPLEPPPGEPEQDEEAEKARLAREKADKEKAEKVDWLRNFKLTGFLQPQLLWLFYDANASPNLGADGHLPEGVASNSAIAKGDGTTTNPDAFRVRRARLKAEYQPAPMAKFILELDPFPSGGTAPGIGTLARQCEAVGIVNWSGDVRTEIGVGIFKVPFGYEIIQSDADRPFVERSWAENNLVPGEFDTGVRATTTALENKLTLNLAVVNGTAIGEKNFVVAPDLNKGKDFVGRVNYDFGAFDVGASGYVGRGQAVDATALRFKQFTRAAVDLEAAFHHKLVPDLGMTKVFAEIIRSQNMDRGVRYGVGLPPIPADIHAAVVDHDELGGFVRLEQELGEHLLVGLRYDFYTPDSAQAENQRDTYEALVAIRWTKGLMTVLEGSHAVDNVHKPGSAPASKHIETLSAMTQVRF